jgi:hypothetical protein
MDNGGSFEFRAQGDYKGTGGKGAYDEFPTEIFSMRRDFFRPAVLPYSDIALQMKDIFRRKADILAILGTTSPSSPDTRIAARRVNIGAAHLLATVVEARIDMMKYLADAYDDLRSAGYHDNRIERCCKYIFQNVQSARTGSALPTHPVVAPTVGAIPPVALPTTGVAGTIVGSCQAWGF